MKSNHKIADRGAVEAVADVFEVRPRQGDPASPELDAELTSRDLQLIASSKAKQRYAELLPEELEAYVKVSHVLQSLGELLKSLLPEAEKYEVRTTSGFNIKSGVRGFIPKDLWFSVCPTANSATLAGMPQLFMIVSERGIECGYGASVSPNDFSQQKVKNLVRRAAPIVFDRLPSPGSPEANEIQRAIDASGSWYFRRKHRLNPYEGDFTSIGDWLRYLKSPSGKKYSAGTISRYLSSNEVEDIRLEDEVQEMASLFEPLLNRDWPTTKGDSSTSGGETSSDDAERTATLGTTNEFAARLVEFLRSYGSKRSEPFAVDEELSAAMRGLQEWLEAAPSVAAKPSISVKVSVGQGGWTKTPWIALLDKRETTSTQRGRYIVFLIAEDLSVTYLTLNQGMTELRARLGQKGAVQEMIQVAAAAKPLVSELKDAGFRLDNSIDLKSDTSAAKNYEIGTIAHTDLQSDALPGDSEINSYLEVLLDAYERILVGTVAAPEEGTEEQPEQALPPLAVPFGIEDALNDLFLEREDVEKYLDIWKGKKNLILQGAPGVGKSFIARRLAYALIGFRDDAKVQVVQFHQSYSYEDFVQGYRPNGSMGFERRNGTFYEFRDRALRDPDGTYVFIIDEINRGNLSKIFGELMLLIEPDKRGVTWKTRLTYAKDGEPDFYVPENLYVLGMMNTADKSLSLVDYALRRRFSFIAMEPLYGSPKFRVHLEECGIPEGLIARITNGMGELNQAIASDRMNLGPGFRIGHSFFTPNNTVEDPEAWHRRVVETEIHPLLEEYWFDAPETADQWRDQLLR